MLREYIRGALGQARYEILEDDGTYYGEIPGFERCLRQCRDP
jgi:hypothetical protein